MTIEEQFDCEAKLLYSLIVAGKSANFTDKALRAFLTEVSNLSTLNGVTPFIALRQLSSTEIEGCLRRARTGNYSKLRRAIVDIITSPEIDLSACIPEDLENIHGIGPKTSRFFIMWVRPQATYAALDVHVLRWLRGLGYDVPKATPQSMKRYREIERIFLAEAEKRGKTARELDMEIWEAGARRTQKTPLPDESPGCYSKNSQNNP